LIETVTVNKDLAGALDLHKKISGAQNIHLRSAEGFMRLSSASASGKALITKIASDAKLESACVDIGVLSSFVRGSGNVEMSIKDDRLIIRGGKVKGEIPSLSEDSPKIEKINGVDVSSDDADWLSTTVPLISMGHLDKNSGSLVAWCDGKDWHTSCTDQVCGACAFGRGSSRIKFALVPGDAATLSAIVASTDKKLTFGVSENRLVISYAGFMVALPTIAAPSDKDLMKMRGAVLGLKDVARVNGIDFTDAIKAVAPFASVKDAAPIIVKLSANGILISATSSAGTIEQKVAAKCATNDEIKLSYEKLSGLIAKIGDEQLSIQALREGKEVTRLTLKTKNAFYLMLTSV
jgi:hypothetical protein